MQNKTKCKLLYRVQEYCLKEAEQCEQQKKFSIMSPFHSVYMSVIANTQIPFAQTPQIQAANLCQMKFKAQNKVMLFNSTLDA